jgi:CheY-like chemotaxis protein
MFAEALMTKLLIIDDDASVRAAMKLLLELHGFEVLTADSGASALGMAQAGSCDVAIIDLFMPGMDGLETLKALRARYPKLHAIMVSGFGMSADAPDFLHMAAEIGACRHLSKPFSPAQLIDCIEQCVSECERGGRLDLSKVA